MAAASGCALSPQPPPRKDPGSLARGSMARQRRPDWAPHAGIESAMPARP